MLCPDRVERGIKARLVGGDDGQCRRVVGNRGRDRDQLEKTFDRAPLALVDVDPRHEFRVRAGLADERAVFGGGDGEVLVTADDHVDVWKAFGELAVFTIAEVRDGDDDRGAFAFQLRHVLGGRFDGLIRRMIFNRSDVISSIVRHNPRNPTFSDPKVLMT